MKAVLLLAADWWLCSSAQVLKDLQPHQESKLWTAEKRQIHCFLCGQISSLTKSELFFLWFQEHESRPLLGVLQSLVHSTRIDFHIEDLLMLFICEFVVHKAELLIPRATITHFPCPLNVLLTKNRNTKRINQNQGINTIRIILRWEICTHFQNIEST